MRKKKQFRRIEWAIQNSRRKDKKQFNAWYNKLLAFVMSFWLEKFAKKNMLIDSGSKMFKTIYGKKKFEAIKYAVKNSIGDNGRKIKKLFAKLSRKAECLWLWRFPKEIILDPEHIHLKEIPSTGRSSINYYDGQGFVYTKKRSYKSTIYLRCKHSEANSCKARATVKNNDFKNVLLREAHNHKCDKKELDKVIFSKTLERIVDENPFLAPLKCYAKAKKQLKGQIKMSHIPKSTYYASFIHRVKKWREPVLPKTIEEFERLIEETKTSEDYVHDDNNKAFYRGVWRGTTGNNIAFISYRTMNRVKRLPEVTLLMDGTFKAVPKHLKLLQLYIINVIIYGRCYPLAYILMERKDFHSYSTVFSQLKKLIPNMNVVNCLSDYEAATRKAIKAQFPNSKITGCYFHYVQAISKAFRRFGLKKNADAFGKAMNKVCALALLPNEFISKGFNSISKNFKNSKRWARFESYWNTQWAKANISVYGMVHRTNNYSESLNRTINLLIGAKRPNIWKLIYNLKIVEMLKSDELKQVAHGALIKTRQKKKTLQLNSKIKLCTKIFTKTEDVEQFLNNMTWNEDLENFFYKQGDAEYESEDFQIIPNNYNVESNFKPRRPREAGKKRKTTFTVKVNPKKRKN